MCLFCRFMNLYKVDCWRFLFDFGLLSFNLVLKLGFVFVVYFLVLFFKFWYGFCDVYWFIIGWLVFLDIFGNV